MAVPDFQSIFLPLLKFAGDGEDHATPEAYDAMENHFQLNDEDLKEMLPSGKQTTFKNRVGWAKSYLSKAILLESPKQGIFRITERGKGVLAESPETLRVKQLKKFPEFKDFASSGNKQETVGGSFPEDEGTTLTPEETFEKAYQELRDSLTDELLKQVRINSPEFFEKLVVRLLVEMGYGGSIKDAGKAIGKSGDEGIDGIIKEDKLGLDVIYIQAKRWRGSVGRPDIQGFVGALHGKRAKKGVFITTGSFTKEAESYVSTIDPKVILIDGDRLVDLMVDYNVGVSIADSAVDYKIKRVDTDFFLED